MNPDYLILLVIILAFLCLALFLIVGRGFSGGRQSTMPPGDFTAASYSFGDISADNVQSLLLAGRKIQAIKLYREQTGVGLKAAKEAVERMEQEIAGIPRPLEAERSLGDDGMEVIYDLLRRRMKIQAIKVYRERTGVGLKEAKEAVDRMEAEMAYRPATPGPGLRLEGEKLEEVQTLLRQGSYITATEMYRLHTGAGPEEARDAIRRMQRELGVPVEERRDGDYY